MADKFKFSDYADKINPLEQPSSKPFKFSDYSKDAKQTKGGNLFTDTVQDVGIGTLRIPETLTGLADIPFGLAGMDRPVSKLADKAGAFTGITPGKWADKAEQTVFSPERQLSNQNVQQAWQDYESGDKSFIGALGETVSNPRSLLGNVVQSVPSMVAGGAMGKALSAGSKIAPALGEGLFMAGQQQANIDPSVDPQKAAALSLGTGLAGGAIGYGGSKIANKLGILDPDTLLSTGVSATTKEPLSLGKRIGFGAAQEGLFEELPQSVIEQGAQNIAENKPLTQDMAQAATLGTLAGGAMGGALNIMQPNRQIGPQWEEPSYTYKGEGIAGPRMPWETPTATDIPKGPLGSALQTSGIYPQQQTYDRANTTNYAEPGSDGERYYDDGSRDSVPTGADGTTEGAYQGLGASIGSGINAQDIVNQNTIRGLGTQQAIDQQFQLGGYNPLSGAWETPNVKDVKSPIQAQAQEQALGRVETVPPTQSEFSQEVNTNDSGSERTNVSKRINGGVQAEPGREGQVSSTRKRKFENEIKDQRIGNGNGKIENPDQDTVVSQSTISPTKEVTNESTSKKTTNANETRQEQKGLLKPTHITSEGVPVIATDTPNVWFDGTQEIEDNYAQPITGVQDEIISGRTVKNVPTTTGGLQGATSGERRLNVGTEQGNGGDGRGISNIRIGGNDSEQAGSGDSVNRIALGGENVQDKISFNGKNDIIEDKPVSRKNAKTVLEEVNRSSDNKVFGENTLKDQLIKNGMPSSHAEDYEPDQILKDKNEDAYIKRMTKNFKKDNPKSTEEDRVSYERKLRFGYPKLLASAHAQQLQHEEKQLAKGSFSDFIKHPDYKGMSYDFNVQAYNALRKDYDFPEVTEDDIEKGINPTRDERPKQQIVKTVGKSVAVKPTEEEDLSLILKDKNQDAYVKRMMKNYDNDNPSSTLKEKESFQQKLAFGYAKKLAAAQAQNKSQDKTNENTRTKDTNVLSSTTNLSDDASKPQPTDRPVSTEGDVKQPWEMTREEFVGDTNRPVWMKEKSAIEAHTRSVAYKNKQYTDAVVKAFEEGKKISDEVLVEFAGLVRQDLNDDQVDEMIDDTFQIKNPAERIKAIREWTKGKKQPVQKPEAFTNNEQNVKQEPEKGKEKPNQAVSLRKTAQKALDDAQTEANRDRQTNTSKRAREAASAIENANKKEALAKTAINIADAIESGDAKALAGVKSFSHVELLDSLLKGAMYLREKSENLSYAEQQKRVGRPADKEDLKHAKYPVAEINKENVPRLLTKLRETKGGMGLRTSIRSIITQEQYDQIKKLFGDKEAKSLVGWYIEDRLKDQGRLQRMGINSQADLENALAEYLQLKAGKKEIDKVKAAEMALVGGKHGIDFFPTPKALAERMVEMAGVKPGMKGLEPSAGNGNLADAAKSAGATVDVIEISDALRNVLEAKGYNIVGRDFMSFDGKGYDFIIMNPPFSNSQDAEHIKHAFDILNPGGKLIAIAGEGIFFRGDKKSIAFRDWLDEQGATVEKLPAGTFQDKSLLATTGANGRLIEIEKPKEKTQPRPQWETPSYKEVTKQLKQLDFPVYETVQRQGDRRGKPWTQELYNKYHEAAVALISANAQLALDDPGTTRHENRVAASVSILAKKLGLQKDQVVRATVASLGHDLGKRGMKDLLQKHEPLTPDEFGIIRSHPEQTRAIMREMGLSEDIIKTAFEHHETKNGGYPVHQDTPDFTSQVVQVADVADSLIGGKDSGHDYPIRFEGKELPNTVDNVIKVMDSMTNEGKINPEIYAAYKDILTKGEIPNAQKVELERNGDVPWVKVERNKLLNKAEPKTAQDANLDLKENVKQEQPKQEGNFNKLVSKDDIPYNLAYDAYSANSFTPEKRAVDTQDSYVSSMKSIYDDAMQYVENDEQRARVESAFTDYKNGYLTKYKSVLGAMSRTMSPMITGRSNFPVERNNKRLEVENKRRDEFLEWDKNAKIRLIGFAKATRSAETQQSEKFDKLKRDIKRSLDTIKGIDDGTVKGYTRALFVSSVANKIKTLAKNNDDDSVNAALDFIESQQADLKKPLISKTNSIWSLREVSKQEVTKKEDDEYNFEGGRVEVNYSDNRVRIFHDEKPSSDVIANLKAKAFKWSPTNKAWQRQITDNAINIALELTGAKQEGVKLSQGIKTTGSTVADIKSWLPRRVQNLVAAGKLKIVQSAEDLPEHLQDSGTALYHTVFHGSPHSFDKFSTENIGTGEGAQAFGYGLYFTDKKDIAEYYRDKLSNTAEDLNIDDITFNGNSIENSQFLDEIFQVARMLYLTGNFNNSKNIILEGLSGNIEKSTIDLINIEKGIGIHPSFDKNTVDKMASSKRRFIEKYKKAYDFIKDEVTQNSLVIPQRNSGRLYQVELSPTAEEYLDWDKPLSEQSDKVKEALVNAGIKIDTAELKKFDDALLSALLDDGDTNLPKQPSNPSGEEVYKKISARNGGDKSASDYLHSLGVRGIRYKAEGGKSDANNYVIFSDEDVSITAKYSKLSGVEALYDNKRDELYLVADMLNKGNLNAVLSHELYHRGLATDEKLKAAHTRFESYLKGRFNAAKKGLGTAIEKEAYQRVVNAETPAKDQLEEYSAYLVTRYEQNHDSITGVLRKAFNDFVAAIRAFLIRNGLDLGFIKTLTPADLAAMSKYGANVQSSQRSSMTGGNVETVLLSAKKSGYKGNIYQEAEEWLRAIAKGLDMSEKARKARAKEMGFFTNTMMAQDMKGSSTFKGDDELQVWYHGGPEDWDMSGFKKASGSSFYDPSNINAGYAFLTSSKGEAKGYADELKQKKGIDGAVHQFYVRKNGNSKVISSSNGKNLPSYKELQDKGFGQTIVDLGKYGKGSDDNYYRHEWMLPYSESQIRSIHAAFDPDYKDSGNLLASNKAFPETITINGKERPTRNSNGQLIHSTEEGIKNFYKWFGDSKVVDSKGRPMVVYHGTQGNFNEFKNNQKQNESGIFFSPNATIASGYAGYDYQSGMFHSPEIGSVMPVYLKIENPNTVDFKGDKYGRGNAIKNTIANKNDGAILKNHYDAGGIQDQYVVFNPNQIKSAIGNTGEFNQDNPDIRFSVAPDQKSSLWNRWFGKSKMVSKGEPIKFYHGSNADFTVFDKSKLSQSTKHATAQLGHFFTRNRDEAYQYGGKVHEVFLSMQNPYVVTSDLLDKRMGNDPAKFADKLKAQGFDGLYIKDAQYAVIFDSNQAKLTSNKAPTFGGDIRFSIAQPNLLAEDLSNFKKQAPESVMNKLDKAKSSAKDLGFSALTQRQLVELMSDILPMAKRFIQERNNYDTTESKWHQMGDDIAKKWESLAPGRDKVTWGTGAWRAWKRRNQKAQQDVSDMMHEMTTSGVDPRLPEPKLNKEKTNGIAIALHRRMKAKYDQLIPEAKKVLDDADKFHRNVTQELIQSVSDKIVSSEMPDDKKAKLIQDIADKFQTVKGPYFPLMRFGEYWLDSADGVEAFESQRELNKRIEELKKEGKRIKGYGKALENFHKIEGVDAGFINKVTDLIDTLDTDKADALKDGIFQLYLSALPEQSMRKRFIHRKGTPGYEQDALRSFAKKAFHDGKQLAKLQYAPKMKQVLDDMEEVIKTGNSSGRKEALENSIKLIPEWLDLLDNGVEYDQLSGMFPKDKDLFNRFSNYTNEDEREKVMGDYLEHAEYIMSQVEAYQKSGRKHETAADLMKYLRHSYANMMESSTHPITNLINQTVFTYFLGFSPSSAIINYLQTPGVALPLIAGRHGMVKSSRAMADSAKVFFTNKDADGHSILPGLTDKGEKEMYKALSGNGTFDRTRSHDLAGFSEEGVQRGTLHRDFMLAATTWFHAAEVANREITALMAYRLEFAKTGNVMQSIEYANDVVNNAHLDYASENRPDLFAGNAARVMLQFKMYSQGMTYLWGKTAYDAMVSKDVTPERKAEARRILMSMIGVQVTAAGVLGLPIGGLLMAAQMLLNMIDDDDEPKDVEVEIQKALSAVMGPDISRIISRGVLSETGADIHGRLSLSDLWIREPDRELEGKDANYYLLKTLFGPMSGIMENMAIGMKMIGDGEAQRGWETMLPNSIKGAAKAVRMLDQGGATSMQGNMIYETNAWEKALQSIGFRPSGLAVQQAQNAAIKNREFAITDTKQKLVNKAARYKMRGDNEAFKDVWAEIQDFNKKYPQMQINMGTIMKSIKARNAASRQSEDGIVVRPKLRFVRDEEDFS